MTTKSLTDCYGRRLTVENDRPGIHVHASETVGPFTSEQLHAALDEVAPAGSYTRTDEEDWQARAEKAEQALTEIAQGGALTSDDITDEMVLKALVAYHDIAGRQARRLDWTWSQINSMEHALRAALTEPTRDPRAEEMQADLATAEEPEMDDEDRRLIADHLAALGYRKAEA